MHILAELTPLDPVAGTRPTLRACSAQDRTITGLNGQTWWPAISQLPSQSISLFDGDFSAPIDTGGAAFIVQEDVLEKVNANARRMVWAGAGVTLYAGTSGQAWPWTVVFKGVVESFERDANRLKLSARVDLAPFEANVLTQTYAGTGGAAGGADLKNKPKPLLFGRAKNVEPVLIDPTNSVFQFSGYGPIQAVNALYERASDFGASVGDYASYAALVAATIPAGRWGTCLAEGMVRLGAPPYGVITGDVEGEKPSGTWIRKTGAIISRICSLAGVGSGSIDSASLTALDTAVARNVNIYIVDQVTVLDLAQRLARPCNAQAGVSLTGKLFVCRVGIGSPSLTLDAQGKRLPAVQKCVESDVSPPYARMEMGAQRSWRVHSFDEIATSAQLIDRGDYDAGTTYRDGNVVNLSDGSRFLYINPTPTAGNAPPNVTYWDAFQSGPVVDFGSQVTGGTKPESNATKNTYFTGTSDPGGSNGSLWKDTSTTPAKFRLKIAGAWVDVSTLVTDTGQLTDGAQLGLTALWSGVSGTGKPADNADVTALQTIVSRLSPTTGQALVNFIASDGRSFSRLAAVGEARDGDVVTFPATLPSVPKISFLPGGNAPTAGQNIAIRADGLTASGFTMKAKSQSVTPGSTVTDTGSLAGGVGEPDRVINRTDGNAPYDGRFQFRFSVTVGNIAPGEPGYVEIGLFVKQGGNWQQAGGGTYSVSGTYNVAVYPGTVDFGSGAEFGVDLMAAEGSGSALSGFTHVQYTPGSVTESSLTPSGASSIPWLATLQ